MIIFIHLPIVTFVDWFIVNMVNTFQTENTLQLRVKVLEAFYTVWPFDYTHYIYTVHFTM